MRIPTGEEPFFVQVCIWLHSFLPIMIVLCLLGALLTWWAQ